MLVRPELSTSTRCRSRMLSRTEVSYLRRVQSSGQGFDEKKERKATESFFSGNFGRSPLSRLEKKVTMSALNC